MRYHRLSVLTVLATAHLAISLAPPWDEIRVKHAWNAVPANWESLGPPPPGTTIDLHVALKPHNENALIDSLYGAHLSKEEVAQLVAPHPDTLELVHSWLVHHGIQTASISTTHGGGWLALTGVPVSQANELLGASYKLYQHAGTNDSTILRTIGYALPTVLHTHVQTVTPTTFFASTHTLWQTSHRHSEPAGAAGALVEVASRELSTALSGRADRGVRPQFLRWLYGTTTYVPAATSRNALGIVGFSNAYPGQADLTTFMALFSNAMAATFTVEQVDGGEFDPSHRSAEGNLMMQYTQAITYPTPHIYYSGGGRSRWTLPNNKPTPDDVFISWFNYVLGQEEIPQTITILYGYRENIVPFEYARSVCDLFAQLGARGVSVLFATGNEGVGPGDCKANDGSNTVQFQTYFPASCPWVTSVGGTTSSRPEVAASLSGGGFSNYFSRPSYQSEAVPNFLHRLGAQHYGLYNPAGRGIPDIAAQALNFDFVNGPRIRNVNGTGCAASTVAGIISLLNDFLLSYRQPPLGFLNPWLYGDGLVGIYDIRSGSNPGCGTNGFPAIAGWDPVTGLGTLDFIFLQDQLYDVILEAQEPTPTPTPTPIIATWYTPAPSPTPRL